MIEHEIRARSTPNLQDLRPWLRRIHLHSDMPQGFRERTDEAIIMSREFSIWILGHLLSPRQIKYGNIDKKQEIDPQMPCVAYGRIGRNGGPLLQILIPFVSSNSKARDSQAWVSSLTCS